MSYRQVTYDRGDYDRASRISSPMTEAGTHDATLSSAGSNSLALLAQQRSPQQVSGSLQKAGKVLDQPRNHIWKGSRAWHAAHSSARGEKETP